MMISRVGLRGMSTTWSKSARTNPAGRMARLPQVSVLGRSLTTVKSTTHDENQALLVAQRKNRPNSPHLTIYKPQITMILSSFHRITGVGMAAAFYALTLGYAATAILGTSLDAGVIVSSFAALPVYAKVGAKAFMAFPFAFHSFNGLRHLVWDFGKELTIKGVYRTGYAVLGLAAVFGSYIAFF